MYNMGKNSWTHSTYVVLYVMLPWFLCTMYWVSQKKAPIFLTSVVKTLYTLTPDSLSMSIFVLQLAISKMDKTSWTHGMYVVPGIYGYQAYNSDIDFYSRGQSIFKTNSCKYIYFRRSLKVVLLLKKKRKGKREKRYWKRDGDCEKES